MEGFAELELGKAPAGGWDLLAVGFFGAQELPYFTVPNTLRAGAMLTDFSLCTAQHRAWP